MPTTPSHALPYPDNTDPADVPADLAALAEAVDAKLDAIAPSQIDGPTAGQILIANASGVVTATSITGDVTIAASGDAQIAAGSVGATELGSSAVTTAKIDNNAVTSAKQPDGLYPPPGAILQYAGNTAPSGWLLCDGSPIDRTTYAALFAAIGTSYGAGNGSTTFNVPDLRGRVPVGKGTHSDVSTLGNADTRTLGDRRPAHGHAGTAQSAGAHNHSGSTANSAGSHRHETYAYQANNTTATGGQPRLTWVADGPGSNIDAGFTATTGSHGHDLTITQHAGHEHSVNVGADTTNTPAFVVVNYLIRF